MFLNSNELEANKILYHYTTAEGLIGYTSK